jgi:hypothetical protein
VEEFTTLTASDEPTWDGAWLRLSWAKSKNMGGESDSFNITSAVLTGTYTAGVASQPVPLELITNAPTFYDFTVALGATPVPLTEIDATAVLYNPDVTPETTGQPVPLTLIDASATLHEIGVSLPGPEQPVPLEVIGGGGAGEVTFNELYEDVFRPAATSGTVDTTSLAPAANQLLVVASMQATNTGNPNPSTAVPSG